MTYSVTDAAGNMASCTFSVTVNDTELPTIACPSNITQANEYIKPDRLTWLSKDIQKA